MFQLSTNNETLRNLEEQVQYLSDFHKENQALASWGIRIIGQVDDPSQLPSEGDFQYGDTYAVGTEAPFDFYIWTRNSITGQPDYWFPFGKISIVGPQGPQGDQGPEGPAGPSTTWFTGIATPPFTGMKEGDLFLNTSNGSIYKYVSGNWASVGNIRGPQGITGPQGFPGPQGPVGPQGPKGDRGDVGGFINIAGILSNTSQLPTPSSLDNLTVAYLVGESAPYTLYIQVGESSETAIWEDSGPFNAATLVMVGGQGQNVWDADTKLDRYTNVTEYNQVYVKAANGGEGTINVTKQVVNDAVVQRQSDGNILVPLTPAEDADAVSKQYADKKLDKENPTFPNATTNALIYGIVNPTTATTSHAPTLTDGMIPVTYGPDKNTIVMRDGAQHIRQQPFLGSNYVNRTVATGYSATDKDVKATILEPVQLTEGVNTLPKTNYDYNSLKYSPVLTLLLNGEFYTKINDNNGVLTYQHVSGNVVKIITVNPDYTWQLTTENILEKSNIGEIISQWGEIGYGEVTAYGKVIYEHTGYKRGKLTINCTVKSGSANDWSIISVSKIKALLGIEITAQDGECLFLSDKDAGYNGLGGYSKITNNGDSVSVGRYHDTNGTMGGWGANELATNNVAMSITLRAEEV